MTEQSVARMRTGRNAKGHCTIVTIALAASAVLWPSFVFGETVQAAAFTAPFRQLELSTNTGGVIESVAVEEGDTVKERQALVRLKSDLIEAEFEAEKARLEATRVQLDAYERTLTMRVKDRERVLQLFQKNIASPEDLDKARLEADLAEIGLRRAQAQVKISEYTVRRMEAALQDRLIRAPVAGRIHRIYKREGEAVQQHGPVVVLAACNPLYVTCNPPVQTAGRIRPGMKALLQLDSRPARRLECTVRVVDTVADVASGTYRVKLTLPNADDDILAGCRGTMTFDIPDKASGF